MSEPRTESGCPRCGAVTFHSECFVPDSTVPIEAVTVNGEQWARITPAGAASPADAARQRDELRPAPGLDVERLRVALKDEAVGRWIGEQWADDDEDADDDRLDLATALAAAYNLVAPRPTYTVVERLDRPGNRANLDARLAGQEGGE